MMVVVEVLPFRMSFHRASAYSSCGRSKGMLEMYFILFKLFLLSSHHPHTQSFVTA